MTMMINARTMDRARTMTVPRWDEPTISKEVQPVGKVEKSKSSKDGGGAGPPPGSPMSLFIVLSVTVDGGEHGTFGGKGGRSADMERGGQTERGPLTGQSLEP